MKVVGFILLSLLLVGLGIAIAEFGWWDAFVTWLSSFAR